MKHPVFLVLGTVILGLVSALTLKEAADYGDLPLIGLALVLALVLAANVGRFILWGLVYRAHPVNITYPLGSMIFPLILIAGVALYDEVFTVPKILGSLLIMAGVSILTATTGQEAHDGDH